MSERKQKNNIRIELKADGKNIALRKPKSPVAAILSKGLFVKPDDILFYLIILFLAWDFFVISRRLPEGVAMPKEIPR